MTDESLAALKPRLSERKEVIAASRYMSIFGPPLAIAILGWLGWDAERVVTKQDTLQVSVDMITTKMAVDENTLMQGRIDTGAVANDVLKLAGKVDSNAQHIDAQDRVMSTHETRIRCLEHGVRGGCPQ